MGRRLWAVIGRGRASARERTRPAVRWASWVWLVALPVAVVALAPPVLADHDELYVVCPDPIPEGETDYMQVRWPGYRGIGVTVFTYEGSYTADGSDFESYHREKMKGDSDSDTLWVPAVTKSDSRPEHDETFAIGFWVSGSWRGCVVTIVDDDAPVVTSVEIVSSPAVGDTYRADEAIDVAVTFDKEVQVVGNAHVRLYLSHDGRRTRRSARHETGSGTRSLTFRYEVRTGDRDSDGISIGPAGVDEDREPAYGFSGLIYAKGTDVPVDFSHRGLENPPGQQVDGRPYVTDTRVTSVPSAGGDSYRAGEDIEVTMVFDNRVEVTGEVGVGLYMGLEEQNWDEAWRGASYRSGSGTGTLVFAYTVAQGDTDTRGIRVVAGSLTTGFFGSGTIEASGSDVLRNPHYAGTGHLPGHKVDTDPPTVSSVQIVTRPQDREAYRAGEAVNVAVVFSEQVLFSGDLQLELDVGGVARDSNLWNGSGATRFPSGSRFSDTVVFTYDVLEGDLAYDGISVGADSLSLNEGSITDEAGNDAETEHDAVAADGNHKVITGPPDTIAPAAVSIAITSDPGVDETYRTGDLIEVTVSFSEDIRVSGSPELDLDFDGSAKTATFSRVEDNTVVFSYTVENGDTDTDGIAIGENKLVFNFGLIRDPAGNDATLTHDAIHEDPSHKVNAIA